MEIFISSLYPISEVKLKCWVWLKQQRLSCHVEQGRDLLQWAFSFTIKHPQEGEMKDKLGKKGGNRGKWNNCWLNLFPLLYDYDSVGVCVSWCSTTRSYRPPNLTFGWYPFHHTQCSGKAFRRMCVTKHNAHSLAKTQRVGHAHWLCGECHGFTRGCDFTHLLNGYSASLVYSAVA